MGARPPSKSPQQEWFDELPQYTRDNRIVGYNIFTGVVNGVSNLVVRVSEQRGLYVLKGQGDSGHWRFDYNSGSFVVDFAGGTQWGQKIVEQTDLSLTYKATEVAESVNFDNVLGKILPTE